jgi:hypothetical protein
MSLLRRQKLQDIRQLSRKMVFQFFWIIPFSYFIEILGMEIFYNFRKEEQGARELFGMELLSGTLKNAMGALIIGYVVFAFGLVMPKNRLYWKDWMLNAVQLGAFVFLIYLIILVMIGIRHSLSA